MINVLQALILLVVVSAASLAAQTPPAGQTPQPAGPAAPQKAVEAPTVRLRIVIARYAGEKRVGSQPHELMIVANGDLKQLRTGAEVPLVPAISGKENYKSVGTTITSIVRPAPDGAFRASVMVVSSSVYPQTQKPNEMPSFRTFTLQGEGAIRDGQTVELASATDAVTGEIIKAEVTINVIK